MTSQDQWLRLKDSGVGHDVTDGGSESGIFLEKSIRGRGKSGFPKIEGGGQRHVQCNLDYPDPSVHRADHDIPDK